MSTIKDMVSLLKKSKDLNQTGEEIPSCSNFNSDSSFKLYENESVDGDKFS